MPYVVDTAEEFDAWFSTLEEDLQDSILMVVGVLQEHGPHLGRPHVDTLEGTNLKNLKELRVQHRGQPYRILFAFDPQRKALLLIGGNKAGDKRFYKRMIPAAEAIFERHLQELKEKDHGETD